ncbi:MAG: glycine cleavage system aminomethyltransferase GcvT [Myxococcota bacterium]
MSDLRKTPLHAHHLRSGARMAPFAGFDMPVDFGSIVKEHAAVRERAGLFDVSHMGQLHLTGPGATACTERLVSCRVDTLRIGQVRYGCLCFEAGGVVDDVTIYREADDDLWFCVNAANIDKDRNWIEAHLEGDVALEDRSGGTGLLALQGPESGAILGPLCTASPGPLELRRFHFGAFEVAGREARISRTGYTGSDGFEIYLASGDTLAVYEALLEAGSERGLVPAGLGARNTLRLEAAMALYGHELDDTTSPLEAGLARFVKRRRGGFIGAEAIEERAAAPPTRQLVGLRITGRGVARDGYPVLHAGEAAGVVTSGAPSPTLGFPVALAYVRPDCAALGTELAVEVRGRAVEAVVVETPFVKAGAA